jgi:two-component system chemotaxis sensor kinase CheA
MSEIDHQAAVELFLAESEEGLQAMEHALVALEVHPADDEALATLFRAVHTLKGNAFALGFAPLSELAHAMEDVLDRLRKRSLDVSPDLVTLLLRAVDGLGRMVPALAAGVDETPADHRTLLAELAAYTGRRPARDAGEKRPAPDDAFPDDRAGWNGRGRTLRVDVDKLDRILNLMGELTIARGRVSETLRLAEEPRAREALELHRHSDRLFTDLQDLVTRARMVPIGPVFRQQVRAVRDIATARGKRARLLVEGTDVEVDTSVIEHLRDPLTHMIRNALDHGIETPEAREVAGKDPCGTITLRARAEGGSIVIEVADDGRGLDRERIAEKARASGLAASPESLSDPELMRLVLEPGFSTARAVTDLSGRGVGMDVVRRNVEALRGSVGIESRSGLGATVTLRLPLTLAIIDGFAVGVGDETFVVPMNVVSECLALPEARRRRRGVVNLRGVALPYLRLRDHFALPPAPSPRESVVVTRHEGGELGLVVDALYGESQAVIKPLSRLLGDVPGISGCTILGSGRVALILDLPALWRRAVLDGAETTPTDGSNTLPRPLPDAPSGEQRC